MSLVALFFLMFLALHVPALSPHALGVSSHAPDLWVLVVLYLALRGKGYHGIGWGIVVGAVRDAVSLDPLGTNAFVLGMLAFAFCEGRRQRGRVVGFHRFLLAFAGALFASWLYLLRILPLGGGVVRFGLFLEAVPSAFWTALLGVMLFPVFDRYRLLDDLCGRTRALPA